MQVYQKTDGKASTNGTGQPEAAPGTGKTIRQRLLERRAFLVALAAGKKVQPPEGVEVPSWWPSKRVPAKVDEALHVHSNTVQGLQKTVQPNRTETLTGPSK